MILKRRYILYAILIVGLINESLAKCGDFECHGDFDCNININKTGVECFCRKNTVRREDGNIIYCEENKILIDASKDLSLATKIETDSKLNIKQHDVRVESNSESNESEDRFDKNKDSEVKFEMNSKENHITSEQDVPVDNSNESSDFNKGSVLNDHGNSEANIELLTESTTRATSVYTFTSTTNATTESVSVQIEPKVIKHSIALEEQIVPVQRNSESESMIGLNNNEDNEVKTESTTKATKLANEIQSEEPTKEEDEPVGSSDSNNGSELNGHENSEANTKLPQESTTDATSEYTTTYTNSDTTQSVPDLTVAKLILPSNKGNKPMNGLNNNKGEDKIESSTKAIKLSTEINSEELAVEKKLISEQDILVENINKISNSENKAGLTTEPPLEETSESTIKINTSNNFDAINNLYDFSDINLNCSEEQIKCQNICCKPQQICNNLGECEANTKGSTIAYTIIGLGCIVAALGFALFKVHKLRRSGRF